MFSPLASPRRQRVKSRRPGNEATVRERNRHGPNPNGVETSSPGLPLRLPWGQVQIRIATPTGLCQCGGPQTGRRTKPTQPRWGWRAYTTFFPRVAEAATLGWRSQPRWGWYLERLCFLLSRSEEHTSELQSQSNLVCRLLLEKKKKR